MNLQLTSLFAMRAVMTAFACLAIAALSASAQTAGSGALTGRVNNAAAQLSLENARVTIANSNREAFTDVFGEYRFAELPPGEILLTVFHTGLVPQTTTVTIVAGTTVRRDFSLVPVAASRAAAAAGGEGPIKLDEFVVASARDTNASTIAINEQRFAGNIKTVLSTDAMGDVIQNNLGEFVKFLPGVDVNTDQMNAVSIGLRGLPSTYTNIAMDGDDVNAAGSAGPTRGTLLQAFSLSNASRIEIYKVPTPDMSASSLGGSINMISRSAFEAARPEFRFKAYLNKNSHDTALSKQPGGGNGDDQKKVFHHEPDFDFSYTVPVSKTFGFSLNAVKNDQFGVARRVNRVFNTATAVANPLRAGVDNPYLTTFQFNVFPVFERRYSVGVRADWKVSPVDVLSFSHSSNWLVQDYEQHNFIMNTGTNPVSWGPDFTHGRPGSGSVNVNNTARYVRVRNHILRLNYRHIGEKWDVTGGVGYNVSDQTYRANSHRQFETAGGRIRSATIEYDGFSEFDPGTITVRNAAGAALDPFDLRSYNFFLNGASTTRDNDSTGRNARVDVKRKLFFPAVTAAIKTGLSTTEQYRARRTSSFNPVFVGQDGIADSADDNFAGLPIDLTNYALQSYAMPRNFRTVTFPSSRRAWELYEQYPNYFDPTTNRRTDLRADALNTEQITERIDATYLMGDVSLLRNRLRLVGGVRYERTTDDGRTVLQDNLAQYQQNPTTGELILNAQNRPIPITSDPITLDTLIYKKLGARMQKEYGDFYPSLNATYNITDNFLGRIGVARTLGRPDFGNILGATNINQVDFDPSSNTSGAALGTITTKNPSLIPWTGQSLDVRLEYYTPSGGDVSVGFFRKQIKNFFATRNFIATADFLESIGLSDEFVDFQVNAPGNVDGIAHITGWEFSVNQPLATLLHYDAAKYFRVFANTTMVRTKGPAESNFRGFTPLNINAGFHFNRRPITFVGKWSLVGKKRTATVGAGNLGAAGWTYQQERLRFDASIDWRLTRRYSLYATGRNIFNNRDRNESYAIGSPRYVHFAAEGEYGVNFQFGVKGMF